MMASLATMMVAPASAQQQKPNILFILADNVGYGDIGAYGGGELRGAPTPRIDQFATEGLRLTQFLVEPACTPSRAALMTGRYSIRSGLSLVAVAGTSISLPATRNHHGRDAARRRLCHCDLRQVAPRRPALQPAAEQGLRRILWHSARRYLGRVRDDPSGPADQALDIPLDKGPQIVEAKRGEPLKDSEALHRRGAARDRLGAGGPRHRLHEAPESGGQTILPLSADLPHALSNLPSKRFEGASRIGQFGDSLMEGDAIVGSMLDTLEGARPRERYHRRLRLRQRPRGPGARDSAATCRTWDRPAPIAANWAT